MNKIPNHVGFILDGNRRWAKKQNLPTSEGHRKGMQALQKIIPEIKKRGIKIATFFVFSVENWKRSKEEVDFLMNLITDTFTEAKKKYEKNKEIKSNILTKGTKIKTIGQKNKLPIEVRKIINEIEKETKNNEEITLNFALSYGGKTEITELIKKTIKNKVPCSKINEEYIAKNLEIPDIDLVIRTGKEKRLSNFFIWQTAYAELYFSDKYWPEFDAKELDRAMGEYAKRQRRFGK